MNDDLPEDVSLTGTCDICGEPFWRHQQADVANRCEQISAEERQKIALDPYLDNPDAPW